MLHTNELYIKFKTYDKGSEIANSSFLKSTNMNNNFYISFIKSVFGDVHVY